MVSQIVSYSLVTFTHLRGQLLNSGCNLFRVTQDKFLAVLGFRGNVDRQTQSCVMIQGITFVDLVLTPKGR
jgi:hypothetical protein